MKLFNGKRAAFKILKETALNIKKEKLKPALAVILVGDDEASKLYIKLKKETAKKVGIEVKEFYFDRQAKKDEVVNKIKELNEDKGVHGIIVQLPLPAIFNTDEIIGAISPKKDVDGFHSENRRLLEKGEALHFWPVLPLAILTAMKDAVGEDLAAKKTIALVNSDIFGQSLRLVLQKEGANVSCIVRKACVIMGVEKEVKEADILISVCGCPNFIKSDMVKAGVVLIDGGVTRFSDGKVMGDVAKESIKTKAAFLTPVPGGIGPLTIALLLKNVFLAAKKA